ncbi:hypothetical protein KSC_059830 [Ktedonobacter sp. SOSP1-52]|uniref:hypothetical protein n=1 Tax=Ktedonobacter sp. SOSP1-52 TaxID=2778366 RepID=UPI00191684A8|nr:hypothetical protein [Ktedonobacter sp. SOSP1-52]GHO67091.1 hypothetical protein KSC_059830 [Ktedonobacter sp. SOSP1-52]
MLNLLTYARQRINPKLVIGIGVGLVPILLFIVGQNAFAIAMHTSSLLSPNTTLGFFGLSLEFLTILSYAFLYLAMLLMLIFPQFRMYCYGLAISLLLVPALSLYYFGSMGAWCGAPIAVVALVFIAQLIQGQRQRQASSLNVLSDNEVDPQA